MKPLTLEDIPRVKAGAVAKLGGRELGEFDQERLRLATRAADLLGYHALSEDITGERMVGVAGGRLAETLRALEIEVLDTAQVIEYQLAKMVEQTRRAIQADLHDWATRYFSAATWQKTELPAYREPVPEFILEKAVRIKEALPEVRFHVQHFREAGPDPFLVASLEKEVYYLDAWSEPRFEGRASR